MELFVFGRFHAKVGKEDAVAAAIHAIAGPTQEEPGCLAFGAYRATSDPRLFYIHSRWIDEPAFNNHASLSHTVRFVEQVQKLIDHSLDVARTRPIA